jgi:hypothetical protein
MAGVGLETSNPIGIAGYGCLGLPSASHPKRLEYFSVDGITSSTLSHDFGHHTLPVGFVCHHMGSSCVNLRMTCYGGVHVMVARHICCAASIFIGRMRSAWLLIGTSLVSRVSVLLQVLGDCGGLLPLNPDAMAGNGLPLTPGRDVLKPAPFNDWAMSHEEGISQGNLDAWGASASVIGG